MYGLVKDAVNDINVALELNKTKKNVTEIVDAVSQLSREDAMKLGRNFKRFPMGCDLTEILVGTCASDMEKIDLIGNCTVSGMLGASIHVCAYAFADIAEKNGMKGSELLREVREATDVPLDLDHFGMYGAMRFPKAITACPGQCYFDGSASEGCPHGRIHSRLVDKEQEGIPEMKDWVELSSSVAVNLTSVQGGEGHAAPIEEANIVAEMAKKYGKGLEAIMFVGDGYEDLITGFSEALKIGADVFVLEGGPFNRSPERLDSFARAVAIARILVPGKIVATNGAYEDECRIGLRTGLNAIITGFPQNHHGYMCGYAPGTAKRGKFGMPRVIRMIKDELGNKNMSVPIQRPELKALARAVKVVGPENVYPKKMGNMVIGDAHWPVISSTPLYNNVKVDLTTETILERVKGDTVAILGGRFVSWALAKKLDGEVDEIIISDADPWVESVTVQNMANNLKSTVSGAGSEDIKAYETSDTSIIASTVPSIVEKISKSLEGAVKLI
ncbi:MAG: 5,10-methenyltetrahydromethanopterin hydrogenase cofactor biosynthesis protein HmdC [Methanobacterium paludis]|nr:5,10-methenyltetrahydromethanopterin hydrogenase cofactor biosynthesis protein HmdC [Methanobacterium paludis]